MLSLRSVGVRRLRAFRILMLLFFMVAITYFGVVFAEVFRHAHNDEAQMADVIVVLGAAQYRGRPSPILKARLDHALQLYRDGLAPRLITTGGQGKGAQFTEGDVSLRYLSGHGVPEKYITAEQQGQSTMQSVIGVAEIMTQMNLSSCIVVSDGYHIHRIKRMLEKQGLKAYGSPRTPGDDSPWIKGQYYIRETVGYILWRLGLSM